MLEAWSLEYPKKVVLDTDRLVDWRAGMANVLKGGFMLRLSTQETGKASLDGSPNHNFSLDLFTPSTCHVYPCCYSKRGSTCLL